MVHGKMTLLWLGLLTLHAHGQGPCRVGPQQESHLQRLEQQNPQQAELRQLGKRQIKEDLARYLERGHKRAENYLIPVVFHVMSWTNSDGGVDGTVDDGKIAEALGIVNEDFNGLNGAGDDIIPAFADRIANPNIRFELASLDPDGLRKTVI